MCQFCHCGSQFLARRWLVVVGLRDEGSWWLHQRQWGLQFWQVWHECQGNRCSLLLLCIPGRCLHLYDSLVLLDVCPVVIWRQDSQRCIIDKMQCGAGGMMWDTVFELEGMQDGMCDGKGPVFRAKFMRRHHVIWWSVLFCHYTVPFWNEASATAGSSRNLACAAGV